MPSLFRRVGTSFSRAGVGGGAAAGGLVTDGLILNLDSTDTNSYSGSGTSWDDLTSENNDFTLVNGPTFSTDDGGTIITDGANDYIKSDGNIDEVNEGNSTFAYVKCTDLDSTSYGGNYITSVVAKGWNNSSNSNINLRFKVSTSDWSTYGYASVNVLIRNSSGTTLINWNGMDEASTPETTRRNLVLFRVHNYWR